jgi:hypothetical protein
MNATTRRFVIALACAALAVMALAPGEARVEARGAAAPSYCSDGSHVFWFVHASDLHIGTRGSTDSDNLSWLVTTGRNIINPLFTVMTGDLTNSTNGNLLDYPNGPYQAEWDQYKSILATAGITRQARADYYDVPGNHDAYNDKYFAFYRANAIQGDRYTPGGQLSWTVPLSFGTYHFVGVNTADNTGASFSILAPYGDYAGLDSSELSALSSDLAANASASATFVFGHHPVTSTGSSQDTYLYYGASTFVSTLSAKGVQAYNYGHAHDNVETIFAGDSYTGAITPPIRYSRVASLGKDSPNSYSVVSVDCNGVNSVTQAVGTWPVVLVTAPVNRYVGSALNPSAYDVPAASNPIRALVFDVASVTQVRFRVDGATTWTTMTRVAPSSPQWAGTWDASATTAGEHAIEVQATGTTVRSHVIKVNLTGSAVNHAPVAGNDAYSATQDTTLTVPAPGVLANDSDPDGDAITLALVTQVAHGTVTLAANGGFTYVPSAGYSGSDGFTYKVTDPAGASSSATVTISVAAAPTTDTVAITSAVYTRRTKTLAVKATSTAAPAATLKITAPFIADMTYSAKTRVYTYQGTQATAPTSVTVTSSAGGSATRAVTLK